VAGGIVNAGKREIRRAVTRRPARLAARGKAVVIDDLIEQAVPNEVGNPDPRAIGHEVGGIHFVDGGVADRIIAGAGRGRVEHAGADPSGIVGIRRKGSGGAAEIDVVLVPVVPEFVGEIEAAPQTAAGPGVA